MTTGTYMPGIKESILHKSSLLKDEVINLRHHFHMHPELSFHEINTAVFIENYLKNLNISFRRGIAGTGIIAMIEGERKSDWQRTIAIRAEMDSLPVMEANRTGYESQNKGVMHACGHDANMAMLLGAAQIFMDIRDSFAGTILLIFQPGEEKSPGGARLLLESGELNSPRPDYVIAQHVLPELATGKVGYKNAGPYMASCDEIYIEVSGKGGHAALPALTTDQIYIASTLVVRLKDTISKKQKENQIPTVLGVGRISGEGATNVIPTKVEIEGTFRTFNEKWRKEAIEIINSVSEETASEYGVKINVNIAEGYPVLENDFSLTEKAINLSIELLGRENVEIFTEQRMSSDDFSFYSALAPSLYYRCGIKKEGAEMRKLHTADFDIDENCLETGTSNLCWLVFNLLSDDPPGL
jgi:amidohydrolase